RRLIKGSLVFVSVYLTCRIKFDFSSTLTTMTLYQCRLKWFASTYCKANAVGLPPSLAKLRKLFCRYATILFALGTPYKLSSGGEAVTMLQRLVKNIFLKCNCIANTCSW